MILLPTKKQLPMSPPLPPNITNWIPRRQRIRVVSQLTLVQSAVEQVVVDNVVAVQRNNFPTIVRKLSVGMTHSSRADSLAQEHLRRRIPALPVKSGLDGVETAH